MTQVIAYQGEPGAYSDEASQELFPEADTKGYSTFPDVFEAVRTQAVELAVVPVENSLAGVVQEVSDLLWEHTELHLAAEFVTPIRHHLLAHAAPVRRALSHPQALAQCRQWLRANDVEAVTFHDTAGAAREVAQRGQPGDGAIASLAAARRYGLTVIATDIAKHSSNRTRFVVIERGSPVARAEHETAKCSLGVVAAHRPGSLAELLAVFSAHSANLTRLDSRPIPDQPFKYRFYIDAELEVRTMNVLLADLERAAAEMRLFGVYDPGRSRD